jgi:hypothetical protein
MRFVSFVRFVLNFSFILLYQLLLLLVSSRLVSSRSHLKYIFFRSCYFISVFNFNIHRLIIMMIYCTVMCIPFVVFTWTVWWTRWFWKFKKMSIIIRWIFTKIKRITRCNNYTSGMRWTLLSIIIISNAL